MGPLISGEFSSACKKWILAGRRCRDRKIRRCSPRQAREAPTIMLLLKLLPLDWSVAAENMPVRPRTGLRTKPYTK